MKLEPALTLKKTHCFETQTTGMTIHFQTIVTLIDLSSKVFLFAETVIVSRANFM